jgi:hypothetical protein
MALEFICSKTISSKKLILPRSANIYIIDLSDNKIDFYYGNPAKVNKLNTWKVPLKAREMEFDMQSDRIGGYVVIPKFYDLKGNLLKIGNR